MRWTSSISAQCGAASRNTAWTKLWVDRCLHHLGERPAMAAEYAGDNGAG
jgi:hypothetical protein